MKYEEIILRVAQKNHTTPAEVEAEMKAALEAAQGNPNLRVLFGDTNPTPEEFIRVVARVTNQKL